MDGTEKIAINTTPPGSAPGLTGSLHRRRGIDTTLRVLAVLLGIAGSLTAVFCAGLISTFSDCSGGATGLCTNHAGLVPVLEWAIVILAATTPLAGGIATCIRGRWPWLPAGLAAGAAMVGLALLVATGQTDTWW